MTTAGEEKNIYNIYLYSIQLNVATATKHTQLPIPISIPIPMEREWKRKKKWMWTLKFIEKTEAVFFRPFLVRINIGKMPFPVIIWQMITNIMLVKYLNVRNGQVMIIDCYGIAPQ